MTSSISSVRFFREFCQLWYTFPIPVKKAERRKHRLLIHGNQIILAIYYTLADMVLLSQCFWYKGFHLTDHVEFAPKPTDTENENGNSANEQTHLLPQADFRSDGHEAENDIANHLGIHRRTSSGTSSFRERYLSIDATHLSIIVPLVPDTKPSIRPLPNSTLKSVLINFTLIFLVCVSGVLGWWLSNRNSLPIDSSDALEFNTPGQVLGYISAALYLGSRIPQLLLNYRRKSTEGISMLFFLFACIGNMTYVLSIVAYSPESACKIAGHCRPGEAKSVYTNYILVNLSWLFGSAGTMMLDLGVFVQYFLYKKDDDSRDEEGDYDEAIDDGVQTHVRRARPRRRSVGFTNEDQN